ncbi:hypothetical protein BWGOE8_58640 [Bacillus mycoides]|uniref:Uncharacterized protein n=2 Tax=Bacillus cereus group TaxID=86661 RepID=A0A2C1DR93_BACCE|nr:hypothetical protein BWGOE8_58640 [Bacillus mycoides]OFD69954.1 hypothetical protein BWGOE9_57880 [Bacillus mycoides]OFD70580.1 hypothetical protein BWGOE10_57690 [Bacillus mycoides]PGT02588.1 hypothetical protein COD09_11645 [Bacillus cereus]
MCQNFDKDTVYFLNQIDPIIRKHLKETDINERDDLSQDIKFKVIDKIEVIKNDNAPNFIEYIKEKIDSKD